MEKVKHIVKVRVFTRSHESCEIRVPDKPLMKEWYSDTSLHWSSNFQVTHNQRNYFYNYREEI